MADKKISALTAATTPLDGTEVLPIVQTGSTVKVANNDLRPKQIQSNATSGVLQIAGPAAAATRVMTTPDANFTAARTDAAQTFTGAQTFSTAIAVTSGGTGTGTAFTAGSVVFAGASGVYSQSNAQLFWDNSNNRLGIGTASPGYKFHVTTTASGAVTRWTYTGGTRNARVEIGLDEIAGGAENYIDFSGSSGTSDGVLKASGVEVLRFASSGNVTAAGIYSAVVGGTNRDVYVDNTGLLGYVSSIRASKINITDITDVSWLYQLNPVSFNYRKKEEGKYIEEADGPIEYGLIAEDTESVKPELCFYDEVDGKQELRGISYSKLITPLLKAVQELKAEVDSLKAQLKVV